jgi:integrase/recombinase XerD
VSKIIRKILEDSNFLFSEFISEKIALGLSSSSIANYEVVHRRFKQEINLPISKDSIQSWIHLLINKGMNPISINFYLVQIRVYAYWLMANEHIDRFTIKTLKRQEPGLKTISDEELLKLLVKPPLTCNFVTYRTWLIVNFIMATGARASTIKNIKKEDIDFENKGIIYRHLKNKSIAIIPMTQTIEKIFRQYLHVWDLATVYLFPDIHGNQLTTTALGHSMYKFCKERGVKPAGPHALRHTFASKFIKNGGNAFVLQRILNHSDLTMTRKYVRLYSNDLSEGFKEFCPLDNLSKKTSIRRKRIR